MAGIILIYKQEKRKCSTERLKAVVKTVHLRPEAWLNPPLLLKGRMLMLAAGQFLAYSGAQAAHRTSTLGEEIF